MHSPFVFDFYQNVYKAATSLEVEEVAQFARSLRHDKTPLTRTDFGAGHSGKGGGTYESSIQETARRSSRRKREGNWLHHLVKHYQPQRLLELGSHLGISSLYQASGMSDTAQFMSLEGDPALAALAQKHLRQFGHARTSIVEGAFTQSLPKINLEAYRPDYVFIDGDHRYEPTLAYVRAILPHMPAGSILVMDDMYWSKGMTKAWNEIILMPELSVTIDLFHLGIAFVKRPQEKQHFILK
ncbi:MAG: O-methyltransferase [Bacteroidia bacterium]